jgi:hypothetical protein
MHFGFSVSLDVLLRLSEESKNFFENPCDFDATDERPDVSCEPQVWLCPIRSSFKYTNTNVPRTNQSLK